MSKSIFGRDLRAQSRRSRTAFFFVLLAVCSALGFATAAPNFSCPKPLSEGGGAVASAGYSFEFKSWGWLKESRFYICHCVRNLDARPLKIDWPEVNVAGYAPLNKTLYTMGSYNNDRTKTKSTTILYGNKQDHIEVQTLFPFENHAFDTEGGYLGKIEKADFVVSAAEEAYTGDRYETISYGEIYVPSYSLLKKNMTPEDIDNFVYDNPGSLVKVSMKFTSRAVVDGEKIYKLSFECDYQVSEVAQRSDVDVALRFDDVKMQQLVFDREGPILFADWHGEVMREGSINLNGAPESKLQLHNASMDVVGPAGQVLGRIPVQYHAVGA